MTERTIGQLVADATQDVSELVRHEIALAKSEMKRDVSRAGAGAAMLGAAGFLGAVGFVLLCVTAARGLEAAGLPAWLSYLIVAVALLLLAGLLALLGKGRLQKVSAPQRTIAATKGTVAALKGRR